MQLDSTVNPQKATKIGVYAGTFDPIHSGHIAFAEAALSSRSIDRVYFLPEPRPRHKQAVKSLDHRVTMVELAVKDNELLGIIKLSQARFTPHETIPVLSARFPDCKLVLLFGDDVIARMLDHMAEWPHLDILANSVELLIAARRGGESGISDKFETLSKVSGLHFKHSILTVDNPKVASLEIRKQIRNGVQPSSINSSVYEYIKKHRLYTNKLS